MVEDSTVNQPHIVSWTNEGDAFKISNVQALEASVLGNYFITKKYASFQRQMRNYGFERWSTLPLRQSDSRRASGRNADPIFFKHKDFKRGRPDLLSKIKKPKTKSVPRRASNAGDESSTLKARLASMEEIQSQLRLAIENLKEANAAQLTQIIRLEDNDVGKDKTIEAMNFRIRSLESGLQSVIGPPYHGQHAQTSPWQAEDSPFQPLTSSYRPSPPFSATWETNTGPIISMPGPSHDDTQIDVARLPPHPNMKRPSFTEPDEINQQADCVGVPHKGSLSRQLSRQPTDQSTQSWLKDGFPDNIEFSEGV